MEQLYLARAEKTIHFARAGSTSRKKEARGTSRHRLKIASVDLLDDGSVFSSLEVGIRLKG